MTAVPASATPGEASLIARLTAYNGHVTVTEEGARNLWAGMSEAGRAAEEAGARAATEEVRQFLGRELQSASRTIERLMRENPAPRGDNADEIIRLRDALADAEYQCARWVTEAASQERRADELSQALADATAGRCRTCHGTGTLMVPDGGGESASEQACPDPVHGERCGHEHVIGSVAYTCERPPHPVDGYLRLYRHAAAIDAHLADGTDEGDDERGEADLVTWGEDSAGDGRDWEIAWGSIPEWLAGLTPEGMSAPARVARAAFLSTRGGNRLGNSNAWNAAARAVLDNRTPWGDANVVGIEMYRWHAVVRSGAPGGDVVKVIGYGRTGLSYHDSLEEWEAAARQ